jgi:hypothetical protein
MMPRPHHVLLRNWYRAVYERAKSPFLLAWAKFALNLDETVAALVCRGEGMPKDDFLRQLEGGFDSTAKVLRQRYDDADLGLSDRFSYLPQVQAALENVDFVGMERALEEIRWNAIESLRGTNAFAVDQVLSSYLQLRILHRLDCFDDEKGQEVFDRILNIESLDSGEPEEAA